jgi:hypothetical protein
MITSSVVKILNMDVNSSNFDDIVTKYRPFGLGTPEGFSFGCLCEQDGLEVWGINEAGELLVYDCNNGFYFISQERWTREVQDYLTAVYDYEFDHVLSVEEIKAELKECDEEDY